MEYGIVKKPFVKLWKEREKHEERKAWERREMADELLSGWAVRILDQVGQQKEYLVETHYGYRGMMHREDFYWCKWSELAARQRMPLLMITGTVVDVMEEPTVRGRVLETLYQGSYVVQLAKEEENGYLRVRTAGAVEGFVPAVRVVERKDSDGYLLRGEEALNEAWYMRRKELTEKEIRELRRRITEHALSYLGCQYRWGGKRVLGMDCSGLVFMSYFMEGILLYRDAELKEGYPVLEIAREKIQPGDLLYFPGHVALYLGKGKYVHSTGEKKSQGCVMNSLDPSDKIYRANLAEKLSKTGSIFSSLTMR